MASRRVPYRKFAQAVRKYDTQRLLDKIAGVSAQLASSDFGLTNERWNSDGPVRQFTLAGVARAAIVETGRRRKPTPHRPVTDSELAELCSLAIEVDHPDLPQTGGIDNSAYARLFARMTYQQAVFDSSDFANIVRSLGLLAEHPHPIRGMPTTDDWKLALGVSLTDYMTIVFQLASNAVTYGGLLTKDRIRELHELGFFSSADLDTVLTLIHDQLARDVGSLANEGRSSERPHLQMWSYNPLLGHPLIDGGADGFVVPVINCLLQKITPLGLFFTGIDLFGADFPRAMGDSFEQYVGAHLSLLKAAGAVIYPEITYGRDSKKTIDYFVILDEVVLLVEVKSFRPTADARAGLDAGLTELASKVQSARNQVDKTAKLLDTGITEVAAIPTDRPVRGLVVTIEPLHHIDTFFYADMLGPNVIESSTASAHDLERVCAQLAKQDDAGERILRALTFDDPTPASITRAVEDLQLERNPVSDALWKKWDSLVPEY